MKKKVLLLNNRHTKITPGILNKRLFVYNGKSHVFVNTNKTLLGTVVGVLAPTKKMGRGIHDSVRNRKKKSKKKK